MPGDLHGSVLSFLSDAGAVIDLIEHPAVRTSDQAHEYTSSLTGARCKNLMLQGNRRHTIFLVLLRPEARLDLRRLASQLGSGRLSFVSRETLFEKFGVQPGAVSPFIALTPAASELTVVVDESVWQEPAIICHPLTNTVSVSVPMDVIRNLLNESVADVIHIKLPVDDG